MKKRSAVAISVSIHAIAFAIASFFNYPSNVIAVAPSEGDAAPGPVVVSLEMNPAPNTPVVQEAPIAPIPPPSEPTPAPSEQPQIQTEKANTPLLVATEPSPNSAAPPAEVNPSPQASPTKSHIPIVANSPTVASHPSGSGTGKSHSKLARFIPPHYLQNPAPEYPIEARRKRQEGTVLLNATIGIDGHPLEIKVHQSSGNQILDQAAIRGVRKWLFHPAYLGDTPVIAGVVLPVRFRLAK